MIYPQAVSLLALLLVQCGAVEFIPTGADEKLRNIIQADQHIVIGSSNALYRISPNGLNVAARSTLGSENRLLVADIGGSYNGNILSCDNERCFLAEIINFANVSWQVSGTAVIRDGVSNVAGVLTPFANGTTQIVYGEPANGQSSRRFIKGGLLNVDFSGPDFSPQNSTFSIAAERGELDRFESFDYHAQFAHNGFIYFVTNPVDMELLPRVVRFCQNDTGVRDVFRSHIEIKLGCKIEEEDEGRITAATFVTSLPFTEPSILLSTFEPVASAVRLDLCAYSLRDIDQMMTSIYEACITGVGQTGFERDGFLRDCPDLSDADRTDFNICNVPGSLREGLEVLEPLQRLPLISYMAPATTTTTTTTMEKSEHFTSLVTTVVENSLFLFAGSSLSSLYQFHISSESSSAFIRSIPLNASAMTNVTHLLSSADGEHIFAMTPNKLFKHPIDQCHLLTDCHSCVTSNDPICGWCALSRTCVRSSQCPSVNDGSNIPQKVFVRNEYLCPRIDAATPDIIHLEQLQSPTLITLATSNILNTSAMGFTYNCVFTFLPRGVGSEVMQMAEQDMGANTFSCLSPSLEAIPTFPPTVDTVNVLVSLRPIQTQLDLATTETPIEITNCSIHHSCVGCISSGVGKCSWCPLSFACISDLPDSSCPITSNSPTNEMAISSSCQAILPHPNTTNYLVHSDHLYPTSPLQVFAERLDIFNDGRFMCRICETDSCSNVIATVSAEYFPESGAVSLPGSGLVRCNLNNVTFPLSKDTPSANLTLQVLFNNFVIDNPENTKVTVYRCQFLGVNCAQCLSLDSVYGCSYCGQELFQPGNCLLAAANTGLCNQLKQFARIEDCDSPFITDFSPKDGPTPGGTEISITGYNLGVQSTDISRISIGDVACTVTSYRPGVGINCTTGSMEANLINDVIRIELNFQSGTIASQKPFNYLAPSLDNPPAMPDQGPASGGTRITVMGNDLGIGSQREVRIRQQACEIVEFDRHSIVCITPFSPEPVINNLLEVTIDGWSSQISGFNYLHDPTFESISPQHSFSLGGTNYTVTGENLHVVQEPRLLVYVATSATRVTRQASVNDEIELLSEPCEVTGTAMMTCVAPSLSDIDVPLEFPVSAHIGLLMDGVVSLRNLSTSVTIHQDPVVKEFSGVMQFSQGDMVMLTISGSRFLFSGDQVSVLITPCPSSSDLCTCSVLQVNSNSSLTCEVRDPEDLATDEDLTVTVHVGHFSGRAGNIRINTTPTLLIILVPVFAGFIILCVVIFIVLFAVFCSKTRQKDQRYDQLMMELERLESSVARECKLGFAELQTDLDELTGDVTGYRLPYHNIQTFLLTTLFPGVQDHPVNHNVQVPSHQRPVTLRALRDFGDLLNDRKTLLLFIQTLEEQRTFGIRDKSTVASLLMIALHNRMDYVTDVLKKLLSQLIRKTVSNSIPKLLLRRTESVAEKMLTNWLAFCLQGYIQEHTGQPMYLLYRAVKNQLEKGPVDVITGEARYSLSEQKLIRQKVDVVPVGATVETEDGLRVPVKLLDCDTISQAKEKLLDSMFKAAPVSKRPRLTEVDLEYLKSASETMILRDEDHSTVVENGWKKINTLKHYWVQEGAMFRIKSRRELPPPGRVFDYPGSIISMHAPRQRALSEAEDGSRVWHLFKQMEVEDSRRSPFLNKKMVSEIYLPRMLSTKSILQNFVDELFNSLFSITHPPSSPTTMYAASFPQSPGVHVPMGYAPGADAVPMAVKYLFDFLDDEADSCKILDSDVVHTWKNNALALRFWVNMIKNPEFVFDINKSHTVDACLSVIAQAFIDGCSSAESKLNIDSPTSKLLYNKEVQGYKVKVKKYYSDIKQMPRIPEDAMQYYLRQLSEYQIQQVRKTGGFVSESAVNELLRYATRYSEPFLNNLRNAGLQQRAYQFEGVLKITRSSTEL